ncbi:Thioredoxin reductase [Serinibacter arcticus]|uniref:Thioredoxin reductase n=2 Tax=Serinibacter arcticus TaxID=1655435 RepID=A0A4Z1E143_9MICO|nr:Thioredoxin reductase [Serinibacter arcticus]
MHAWVMENTEQHPTPWDVVIVGGGSAGLSAALTLARAQRRVLVLDGAQPRNRFAGHMHGVLGHDGRSPLELLEIGRREVASYGGEVRPAAVSGLDLRGEDGLFRVHTDGGTLAARAVLVATGLVDELPAVPGLRERWGRDVNACPYCHGAEVAGRPLGVVATSAMGVHHATMLRQWSPDVTFFSHLAGDLDAETLAGFAARGVRVVAEPVTEVVVTDDAVRAVVAGGRHHPVEAIFTGSTMQPLDALLVGAGAETVEAPQGFTVVQAVMGRTSVPGLYAAGNVVNPAATVPVAIAEGFQAGVMINSELLELDVAEARALAADRERRWEERYGESAAPQWTGHVNASLGDVAAAWEPGAALDLGAGEGGDALWLAGRGWEVTAVDISATALERGRAAAQERGVEGVTWVQGDLVAWQPQQTYDLVSAQFLQDWEAFPREQVLRRAMGAVERGGRLVLVSHASMTPRVPPADGDQGHHGPGHHAMPTLDDELATLGLPDHGWVVETAEVRRREVVRDGETWDLGDNVVVARRLG